MLQLCDLRSGCVREFPLLMLAVGFEALATIPLLDAWMCEEDVGKNLPLDPLDGILNTAFCETPLELDLIFLFLMFIKFYIYVA